MAAGGWTKQKGTLTVRMPRTDMTFEMMVERVHIAQRLLDGYRRTIDRTPQRMNNENFGAYKTLKMLLPVITYLIQQLTETDT